METEQQSENSLRTVALILLCCGAVKMLHLLGVISVEGEWHPASFCFFFSVKICCYCSSARESQRQYVLQGERSEHNTEGLWAAERLVTVAMKKKKKVFSFSILISLL